MWNKHTRDTKSSSIARMKITSPHEAYSFTGACFVLKEAPDLYPPPLSWIHMDTPYKHWLVSTVSTVSISYREESKVVVEVVKNGGGAGAI
jgi:hypothetical protein